MTSKQQCTECAKYKPLVSVLLALLAKSLDALRWASGADDFQDNGKARAGWEKVCRPVIDELAQALSDPLPSSVKTLWQSNDRDFGVGVPGLIATECYALRDLLIEKNKAYGNSALDPVRIFSKADPEEQIRVRLDDKLSRLSRGSAAGEDVEKDLLGYLILLRVARRLRRLEKDTDE